MSMSWKSIRAPAGRCRSSPRRPACRWPGYAALVMVGKTLDELGVNEEVVPTHFSVKESVFPFNKFPGVDIILGPGDALDRRSDGHRRHVSRWRSPRASWRPTPPCRVSGTIFISRGRPRQAGRDPDRPQRWPDGLSAASSTRGTAKALRAAAIPVEEVPKLQEGRPNLIDYMKNSADRPGHQHAERQGRPHRRGQDPRRGGGAPA